MMLRFRNAGFCFLLSALCVALPVASAREKQASKIKASAIQVMMIQSEKVTLPAEFRASLYEQLIDQLQKESIFSRVYRDGDRTAASVPDLITLQCTVEKFKEGSEKMRQVTTVAGTTSITLRCRFRDQSGTSLLEREITGNVRFFGGNLKATSDFAKKAASVAEESFSSSK
jgi:hypothetical protein